LKEMGKGKKEKRSKKEGGKEGNIAVVPDCLDFHFQHTPSIRANRRGVMTGKRKRKRKEKGKKRKEGRAKISISLFSLPFFLF